MNTEKGFEMQLPEGPFEAYLFDCDGTIADSMPLHFRAWQGALASWNCNFSEELFYAWAGRSTAEIVKLLNQKYALTMDPEKVDLEREALYLASLPKIQAVPAVLAHIEAGFGKLPMAVVSGSRRASVTKTLEFLKLLDRFQTLVGAEDYRHGKPHPEPFLVAAERLKVRPERCLVFEDADLGLESAKAAGMKWVRVPQ
jgi:HAD superfamily hydrolase (TIGR01509 family)